MASLAPGDSVFGADLVLVWAEAGIGIAAHFLDRGQELVVGVDTPVGIVVDMAAGTVAGIAEVEVDLPAVQT